MLHPVALLKVAFLATCILYFLSNVAMRIYYQAIPDDQLIRYFSIKPFGDVCHAESFWLVSENEASVSAPAIWYDDLVCTGGEGPFKKVGTQAYPSSIKPHSREIGVPWEFKAPTPPVWADSCYIKGVVFLDLPADRSRSIPYVGDPFDVVDCQGL